MADSTQMRINITYRVGDLLDAAKSLLGELGTQRSPLMVDGFVAFNPSTAKYDQKYLSLCQYRDPNSPVGKPIAKIDAVIFPNHLLVIESDLKSESMSLSPDLRAVFYGYIDIFKPFGKLQLVITGVDLERTRQVTEGAKDLLRRKLKQEGVFDHNRRLPQPLVPLRIALVTSRGSAAESDFMTKLEIKKFAFEVTTFYVNTSGQNVAISIPEAFVQINSRATEFDLVVLARGGGDHVDLASFSLEGPVRAVVGCAVPVWSAIGHSTDDVLANEVASKILANPNDAASELNTALETFRIRLEQWLSDVEGLARSRFQNSVLQFSSARFLLHSGAIRGLNRHRLIPGDKRMDLISHGSKALENIHRTLLGHESRLGQRASETLFHARDLINRYSDLRRQTDIISTLEKCRNDIEGSALRVAFGAQLGLRNGSLAIGMARSRVEAIDPARIMALGYAVLSHDGELLSSANQLSPGDSFLATMKDGKFYATVDSVAIDL